jgi:Tfp pilus assembly protein PilX
MISQMKSSRGMILLLTLVLITAVSLVAWAVFSVANQNYQFSQRNEYRTRAKALADSELEFMYYLVQAKMSSGISAANVCTNLSAYADIPANSTVAGNDALPSTSRTPFFTPPSSLGDTPVTWNVKRSVSWSAGANATGANPVSPVVQINGTFNYFSLKVEVYSSGSAPIVVDVKEGRNMTISLFPITQGPVNTAGDMELAPSGVVNLNGTLMSNGTVHMGAKNGGTLSVNGFVLYYQPYAAGTDASDYNSIYNPNSYEFTVGTTALADGSTVTPPVWTAQGGESAQVASMSQQVNLLGGNNAQTLAIQDGGGSGGQYLFGYVPLDSSGNYDGTAANATNYLVTAENNIYRAAIVPPPSAVAAEKTSFPATYTATDYPGITNWATGSVPSDDPILGAMREYNQAGLIITVNPDGSANVRQGASDTTPVTILNAGGTPVTGSSYAGVVSLTTTFDIRQQKSVALTVINIGKLTSALAPSNGLLYVYLANGTASQVPAVQLINGATTPGNSTSSGFSVVTNGGLYVEGNYNTVTSDGSTSVANADGSIKTDAQLAAAGVTVNPALLMADSVTVLSSNWDSLGSNTWTSAAEPWLSARNVPLADNQETIAAAIITGNVADNTIPLTVGGNTTNYLSSYVYSGGIQNLIGFEEDWSANDTATQKSTVNFYGSINCLFQSAAFSAPFQEPYDYWNGSQWVNFNTTQTPDGNAEDGAFVYSPPKNRSYTFNDALAKNPAPGTPNPPYASRGDFVNYGPTWNPL